MEKTVHMPVSPLKEVRSHYKEKSRRLKDPFSSLSHLIFAGISLIAGIPLIVRAFNVSGMVNGLSTILFVFGLVGLYTSSGIYHALDISETVNTRLRKIDHGMIYILIAGSYSPICLNALEPAQGLPLFCIVWGLALLGILLALFWITCPKWLSASIYILMGWLCIFSMKEIVAILPSGAFAWLLIGGIIYTIGGVIYALKLPLFGRQTRFSNHDLFHIFCIGGSFCHYITMLYVSVM